MKKRIVFSVFMTLVLVCTLASVALAKDPDKKGNGLPKGDCYNLNIIASPNQKNDNFTGGQGKRIFVDGRGITQIFVYGDDTTMYEILDRDGTDGKVGTGPGLAGAGITFPYDETQGKWEVTIWVRLLGPQTSTLPWKTYYWDGISQWVMIDDFTILRDSKFKIPDGTLLDDAYQNIMWELDGRNFKILQMRIFLD